MKPVTLDTELFSGRVADMPADGLSDIRAAAARAFVAAGFPSPKLEDWKYTNLAPAAAVSNAWLNSNPSDTVSDAENDIVSAIGAHWILLRNGHITMDPDALPPGVTARLLSSSDAAAGQSFFQDNALSQFNLALLQDALVISVQQNARLEKPIGILIQDTANNGDAVSQFRVIVEAASGSHADFLEVHASGGEFDHYANGVIELNLADSSSVDYLRLQQRHRRHIQSSQCIATIADNAVLHHTAFDLGGALVRNDLRVTLNGRDSRVTMNGLYLAGDRQHIDNHTRVDHRIGPSYSSELYRGILNRRARCVFNGKAVVHAGADGTDAQQANNNLLLSEDAEVDTKPELEIYADDVKCSHGATVGQLDDSALFYLRTRGLDEATATALITRAFAAEILGTNTVSAAYEYLERAINERLDKLIGNDLHE